MTVEVTDSQGASDQKTFSLTVNSTNDLPVIEPVDDLAIDEGLSFSYQLAASDVDSEGPLTFSIFSGPSWLGVDANGLLTGTPSNDDVGSNDVTPGYG